VRAPAAAAAPRMQVVGADENDVLLGELAFSAPDQLPALVRERLEAGKLGDAFYKHVEDKVSASADLEERETLRMLSAAVRQLAEEARGGATAGASAGAGGVEGELVRAASEEEVAEAAYDALIDRLVAACAEEDADRALAANVDFEYERIDKRFLDRLDARASAAAAAAAGPALAKVKDAIAEAMRARVAAAAEKLKVVLTAGGPGAMRDALETLAAKGGLDEAVVLLLQGNIEQAKAAGMGPAVQAMTAVLDHAAMLKDARLSPEVRLIRRLLRTDDEEVRVDLLMTALKPNKGVMLADGTVTSGVRVNGKKFVQELRGLIEQYSNVEEAFAMRLSRLGEESEAVARKLFDMEEKDVKDLQEEAFHRRSVSVWDLEQVEMREEVEGRKASWEGRLGQVPSGFDEHGKMAI
jgi:hypothetical protein